MLAKMVARDGQSADGRADRLGDGIRLRAPHDGVRPAPGPAPAGAVAAGPVPPDPGRDRRGLPDQHHDREPGGDGLGARPDPDPAAPRRRARPGPGRRGPAAGLVDGRRAVQPRRGRDAEAGRADAACQAARLVGTSAGLNLLACSAALATFWLMAVRRDRPDSVDASEQDRDRRRDRRRRRFASTWSRRWCRSCRSRSSWSMPSSARRSPLRCDRGAAQDPGGDADRHRGRRADESRSRSGGLAPAFFEGAGYAYHHVISLIVAASTFAEGVRLSGLIERRDPVDRPLARPRDGRRPWWRPGAWPSSPGRGSRRRSPSWSSSSRPPDRWGSTRSGWGPSRPWAPTSAAP